MNCQQSTQFVDAYADGELDAAACLEMEQHLQSCPACAGAWLRLQSLRKSLKSDALYFTAPTELRQRIQAALPPPKKEANDRPARNLDWNWSWNWLTTAISGAFAVCLALLLTVAVSRPSSDQQLAREAVSSHVRSLMLNHALDVASTDQHTVKPWFDGKLDFSPPVKDLKAQEFPLIGGRLDYLGGRSVAALVFQRRQHLINLFVWPAKTLEPRQASVIHSQGYNLIHWSDAGMVFWAVSNLNAKELMEFVQQYSAGQAL